MTDIKYPRGAEWRKWDLHFHTPSSYDYKDKSVSNQDIIQVLKENEISVVAITDHHVIDCVRIKELQKLGKKEGITVLPGIEFLSGTIGRQPVHFIGIFSEDSDIEFIWGQIENRTEICDTKGKGKKPNEIYCDLKITAKLIKEELGGIVSIHAGEKSNSVENITHSLPHGAAQKTDIAHIVDIYELGKYDDMNGYIKNVFPVIKRHIPMIICSDNHNINQYQLKENCWIKSDPTFEGLRQLIYEPKERVRIQKESPALDYEKPYFSHLFIMDEQSVFQDDNDVKFGKNAVGIPLNQNLVTIIGGRGEGKSMLTDYFSSSFISYKSNKKGEYLKNGNIYLEYSKTNQNVVEKINLQIDNTKHAIDFIYINQGYLKNKVDSDLAADIQKLAKLKQPEFEADLDSEVIRKIDSLIDKNDFVQETDESGNKINSVEYIEADIKSVQDFIKNITTEKNKEKLNSYSSGHSELHKLNARRVILNNLEIEMRVSIVSLNEKISSINNKSFLIPLIKDDVFKTQTDKIALELTKIEREIEQIKLKVNSVKDDFKDYKGDLTTLLGDIDKFQSLLFEKKKHLDDIKNSIKEHDLLKKQIYKDSVKKKSLISRIIDNYLSQKSKLEEDWANFSNIDKRDDLNDYQKVIMSKLLNDLSVDVHIHFDEEKFYDLLYHCIDGSVWRVKNKRDAQKEYFGIESFDTFFDFMRNKYNDTIGDKSFHTRELKALFFHESSRKKFISVRPTLKYKGKDLNRISVGQRGTVYLKMMLATEAFAKPIIFDQPEDDLDNKFIMEDLVQLFKELKKYRQVIIVTHNANLVVNSDAEQVIVAENLDGVLSYSSGSLENITINNSICSILEGGKEAFENRRNKYRYSI